MNWQNNFFEALLQSFKVFLDQYTKHMEKYGPVVDHVGCPLLGQKRLLKADADPN